MSLKLCYKASLMTEYSTNDLALGDLAYRGARSQTRQENHLSIVVTIKQVTVSHKTKQLCCLRQFQVDTTKSLLACQIAMKTHLKLCQLCIKKPIIDQITFNNTSNKYVGIPTCPCQVS